MANLLAGLTCAMVLALPAPATAVTPRYSLCRYDAITRYPYSFLLSTGMPQAGRPDVRNTVHWVQKALRYAGFYQSPRGRLYRIDGWYGPKTRRGVARYQAANGLTVDGKVGAQTWRDLGIMFCGP